MIMTVIIISITTTATILNIVTITKTITVISISAIIIRIITIALFTLLYYNHSVLYQITI